MINTSLICKSNHWPARLKKIVFLIKRIIKFKKELKFNDNTNYDCNIILANDKLIKQMNCKFRNIDSATDVLTFVSEIKLQKKKKRKICDIFLSAETLKKDAKYNGVNFYNHLTHLIIHSCLHINGYDHKLKKDFNKMTAIEIKVLGKLGIDNPYNLLTYGK